MQRRDAAADVLVLLPVTRNKKIMSFEIDFENEGFCGLGLSCIDLVRSLGYFLVAYIE